MNLFDEVVALTAALDAAVIDYAICGGRTLMLDVLVAEGPLEAVWQTRVRIAFSATGEPERALWGVSRTVPRDIVDIQRLEEVSRGEHDA